MGWGLEETMIMGTTLALLLALIKVAGSLWHGAEWPHWFGCVLHCMSGFEVFACSINIFFNYVDYYLSFAGGYFI